MAKPKTPKVKRPKGSMAERAAAQHAARPDLPGNGPDGVGLLEKFQVEIAAGGTGRGR